MKNLIAFITIFSIITPTWVGFADPIDSSNSIHSHEEVDHHHHEDDHGHHHHGESTEEAQKVVVAPFVEEKEHTHEHQHCPNTPPHEHSHSHSHSHGHPAPGPLAWGMPSPLDIKTISKKSEKFTPSQDKRPEDPYLASIFRPPIFLS